MAKKIVNKNGTKKADTIEITVSKLTIKAGKGNDKITLTKGKNNTVYGEAGNDTITVNGGSSNKLYGGAGNDVFVIGKSSTGKAEVKDFSVKKGNTDSVKISGGTVKSIGVSGSDVIVKGGKSAALTLKNAKNKTFTVTDTLGNYTVSGSNVKLALGKNYKGTLTAASFITTVDARKDANAIKIKGNAKNNTIYGGVGANTIYGYGGNDTLNGGAGNDTLYGGVGTDKLTGGTGRDTFVYANGDGKDTITDYTAGQDTLQISSGSIGKTALANSNKDLVFTVGSGTVTLTGAAAKAISLKDSRGSYTASNTAITLGSDFTGTMDAAKYLASVKNIDGSAATKAVNITGNAQANVIKAGKTGGTYKGEAGNDTMYGGGGNDTLNGGAGNDTLYGGVGTDKLTGGTGRDTFVYANGDGKDTITDYTAGQDTLQISSGSIGKTALANSNKDLVFTVGSGTVTLTGAAAKAISLKDSRGNYTASNTAITLGSNFTGTMDATKYLSSVKTIDGRNVSKAVNIIGNAQDNIIYAGKAGGKLNGGAGDDVYTINLPNESKVSLIEIDNSGQLDSDADCLVIENLKGVNPDIHFDRKRTVLTINTSQGTIITVKNWDTNPLSYLLLSGISTLTTDQINSVYGTIKYVKISKNSTTYYGDIDTQKIDVACLNSDIHTGISGDIVTIIGSTANGSNTITGGQNNRIYGGPGSDLIKDSKYRNTIYGGDGDDEIHGSTVGKIYGDNGDDIIEVLNASGYFVNGGAGSDQITVVGRSGSFYGEDGNDTFTIYGTSDENYNIQIDGGSGNDTYICDIRGLEENGILTIDNQSASKTDMDFLKVMWTKAEEFILSLNEDSTELTIKQSSNNAGIVVKGWDTCPLSKIEFSDATYTAEQINTMVAASSQVDLGALQSACLTFGYSSVMGNQELTELTIAGGNKQQIQVVPTNTS